MKTADFLKIEVLPVGDQDLLAKPPLRDRRLRAVDVLESIEMELQGYEGLKELAGSKNRGDWVDELNKWMGIKLGNPYCLTGILFCLRKVETRLAIKFDLPKLAGTQEFFRKVADQYKVTAPSRGCIGILQLKSNPAHGHAFYCGDEADQSGVFPTFEFNTDMGGSRDGEGNRKFERNLAGDSRFRVAGYIDLRLCYKELYSDLLMP